MADPRNLWYWKQKAIESILKRKNTPCPDCGGSGDTGSYENGVTVLLCRRCDQVIRYMAEEPRIVKDIVG